MRVTYNLDSLRPRAVGGLAAVDVRGTAAPVQETTPSRQLVFTVKIQQRSVEHVFLTGNVTPVWF